MSDQRVSGRVLGVPIDAISWDQALERIRHWLEWNSIHVRFKQHRRSILWHVWQAAEDIELARRNLLRLHLTSQVREVTSDKLAQRRLSHTILQSGIDAVDRDEIRE